MPDDTYVESREFTLRIEVRCAFPADYDGEADGYAWWTEIEPATAEIVRAAVAILARQSGCRVRPANRGRPADEEVTLLVERTP
ncbi:MAG TPA: hypothetical protein VN853_10895 [Polyangia bacterium]|nr:hypothetical protein [Polyangia bacterium]